MTRTAGETYAGLPLQGREERRILYDWMTVEEKYVAAKFDSQRHVHDATLHDLDAFWIPQIVQYLDRAKVFLESSAGHKDANRRHLELLAQQALAKGMMTFKGLVEASIRVYGPLPEPGVPSGEVKS